ncbi:TetR/AcrR family transcriptional regulator [Promicromonospora panici]|uniref:TetR/AcrR family transcriptional regulator n=1 Tax=Promicromonospora panici TaxID=2219658 RepID=UPI00101D0E87|nr:TetR/AcrR family transcriptional regulator [Promicromonospora panici]
MDNVRPRAPRMAPEDRKAAIIDSVLPLVAERGNDVTSRELAQAAGVAEGTLFRAFGDKTALVGAVAVEGLHRAAGPEQALAELTAIDTALPLERRLELVIETGRDRTAEAMRWMSVLRHLQAALPPVDDDTSRQRMTAFRDKFMAQRLSQHEATVEGITAVLAPDLHRLRVPVDVAISLIESAIAGAHTRFDNLLPAVPADVLADALVNGLAGPEEKRPGKKPGPHRPDTAASSTAAPGVPTPGSPAPSLEGNCF